MRGTAMDLLGQIDDGLGYDELLPDSIERSLGHPIRVLGLAALIRSKERTGRDKDRAVLPILRRTLEESESR
jgi:hypothetical protein